MCQMSLGTQVNLGGQRWSLDEVTLTWNLKGQEFPVMLCQLSVSMFSVTKTSSFERL